MCFGVSAACASVARTERLFDLHSPFAFFTRADKESSNCRLVSFGLGVLPTRRDVR
eukprot:SAG11_NODE_70_length_18450_cov_14.704975_8_plen_56_part_00